MRGAAAPTLKLNLAWDDLRYFLALARAGTLSEAGRTLGVNHVTVGRRLAALEEGTGSKLFVRSGPRMVLSDRGKALLEVATEAEEAMQRCARTLARENARVEGVVRISTPQMLASIFVLPTAASLRASHPGIVVDIVETTRFARLSHQEADLALRMTFGRGSGAGDAMITRRLGEFSWKLFASPSFLEEHGVQGPITSATGLPIGLYDDDAPGQVGLNWLEETGSNPKVALYGSSMYAMTAAAQAGLVATFLPEPQGEWAGLVAISPPVAGSVVHLLVHPDLRSHPRITTVGEHLAEAVRSYFATRPVESAGPAAAKLARSPAGSTPVGTKAARPRRATLARKPR